MGTWVHLAVEAADEKTATDAVNEVIAELQRIEGVCDFHNPDSALSAANLELSRDGHTYLGGDILFLTGKALEFARETDGAFDPTVAPLMKLWDFSGEDKRAPSTESIAHALDSISYKKLELNKETIRSLKDQRGLALDFGGIAKGYAADRACEILKSRGVDTGLVQVGGSIVAYGRKRSGRMWRIGIQHPRKNRTFHSFELMDAGVATSGDYQKYFEEDGIRYHHVLNPHTGFPVQNVISVTVVAKDGISADAYSTALMVLGDVTEDYATLLSETCEENGMSAVAILSTGDILEAGNWESLPSKID